MSDVLSVALVPRIRSEFLEMPGLRLTVSQARRLWALDDSTCAQILNHLVDERFLHRTENGLYQRATEGAVTFSRPPAL